MLEFQTLANLFCLFLYKGGALTGGETEDTESLVGEGSHDDT